MMEHNYYINQLAVQQKLHRISTVLAVVCFAAAAVLILYRIRSRRRQRTGRKKLPAAVAALMLGLGCMQNPVSAAVPGSGGESVWAEIRVVSGQSSEGGNLYLSPVQVEVQCSSRDASGALHPVRIQYSSRTGSESLEMDPGYGTSVAAQLQSLGISWLQLLSESGIAEAPEGKRLQFAVAAEGSYLFQAAGSSLSFSIGGGEAAASGAGEGEQGSAGEPGQAASDSGTEKSSAEQEESEKAAENSEEKADTVPPSVRLEMELLQGSGERRFAAEHSMRIRVEEEHFDPSWEPEVQTAVKNGVRFSGWKKTGSGAEGTLTFQKEGEYNVVFQCRDLAGNQSERAESGVFTVDRTVPSIQIRGVKNGAAYDKPVRPVIQIRDTALCLSDLSCSLSGAKSGTLDMEQLSEVTETETGASVALNHLPEKKDDVYTLSVRASDEAGNTAEEEVVFAMDQYGSSYLFSDETQALVDAYYTAEPVELVLSEINTSPVAYEVSVSKDGVPRVLEEGKEYSVEARGGDGDWMIYLYRIFASNFTEEGVYHVDITSRDQADNVNNSQVRGARIDFAVDRTPPVLAVEDLEDGAVYPEPRHVFTVRAADRAKLSSFTVQVDGETVCEKESFTDKETITLKASDREQKVQVTARDAAGNEILSEEYRVTVGETGSRIPDQKKGSRIFLLLLLPVIAGASAAVYISVLQRKKRP